MTRFGLAVLAVALSLPARAGVVLQYEDDEKKQTTLELEGKKFRSTSEGGRHDGNSIIFDGDKHVFYSLDDKDKSYRRMDEASGAAMATNIKEAMERAKAKMTPEQQAKMEAFLAKQKKSQGDQAPPTHRSWTFERAGGSQKIAGYSCDNYRVLRDGKLESEGCFVPWGAGPFRKDDFQAFEELGRFFEKTFAAMSANLGRAPQKPRSDDWLTHFVETAPGFPASMDRVDKDGKRTHQMRLTKIRASLAAGQPVRPARGLQREAHEHARGRRLGHPLLGRRHPEGRPNALTAREGAASPWGLRLEG